MDLKKDGLSPVVRPVLPPGRTDWTVRNTDNMDGLPLVFELGEGEVIRGWEIGFLGTRVGGERRLDILPELCSGEDEEILGAPPGAHWLYNGMFLLSLISPKMVRLTTFVNFVNSETR